jgi:myo-inositol-1(or 4)-monophosphatase
MSQQLHPMLNIAVKAARAAGSIINRAALDIERLRVDVKGANDFVTEVDHASEAAIIDIILQAYPDHGILAEESGRERGNRKSDYLWIIDPLDGTTNFIHGLPVYAVSIALAFRGKMEQAVVYDPARNDLFYASKGRGAFLNDRRLRVSKRVRLQQALIGTGFPFRRGDSLQRYMQMLEKVMTQCAGVRRPGAAALDLCYVAAGWYDGFFESGLSPWDVAAGSLMITEAGGLVGNFTGEADFLHQREVVAGSPKIYGQLVQMLAPFTHVIDGAAPSTGTDESDASSPPSDQLSVEDAFAGALASPTPAKAPAAKPTKPPAAERRVLRTAERNAQSDAKNATDHATEPTPAADSAQTTKPARTDRKPTVSYGPSKLGKGPRPPREDPRNTEPPATRSGPPGAPRGAPRSAPRGGPRPPARGATGGAARGTGAHATPRPPRGPRTK